MLILTSAGENGGTKFFLEGENEDLGKKSFKSLRGVANFIVDEVPEIANQIITDYRTGNHSEAISIEIADSNDFLNELERAYLKEYNEVYSANEGE
jgi:hypothetical protein